MQNPFEPLHLALTLLKGYAKEYKNRNWFDQIYFSKLSMYHEQEGYIPILYDFNLHHDTASQVPIPDKMLMTFHYPQQRVSNLNGLVILGGEPDIYDAYQTTQLLTPALESLFLEKHNIQHDFTIDLVDTTMVHLTYPQRLRSAKQIMERSYGKTGEDLSTFFPFLDKEEYDQDQLALPQNFMIDAVFMIKITDEFFTSNHMGSGIKSIRLYQRPDGEPISPSIVFPLVFKWQPFYNDILDTMKQKGQVLPSDYKGILVPNIVIFKHRNSEENTALLSTVEFYQGSPYLHVALARSGYPQGQPLSLVHAALKREKFGKSPWVEKIEKTTQEPISPSWETESGDDLIAPTLVKTIEETQVTTDGVFDLGKLRSIKTIDHN